MSRKKISEFRAKTIVGKALNLVLTICQYKNGDIPELASGKKYVLKVDQGIKKRGKQGLLELDFGSEELLEKSIRLRDLGYSQFIVEEFLPHPAQSEKYLSLERVRDGIRVFYSNQGGIEIENNLATVQSVILTKETEAQELIKIARVLGVEIIVLVKLLAVFESHNFAFLEINPLVVMENKIYLLDLAVEVDSAAELAMQGIWSSNDYVDNSDKQLTKEEKAIQELNANSQASLKLEVLNPDGAVWMLLSGGGASIVLADEAYNLGWGKEVANYGEYSGNPNRNEVEIYTNNLLSLLIKSKAENKVLIIAGGVANFTDIRHTFAGILLALEKHKEELLQQRVTVFVRRGGPYHVEGLAKMKSFLEKNGLLGLVAGPELPLTDIIQEALRR